VSRSSFNSMSLALDPRRRKYPWSECGRRSRPTVMPEARRAKASTCPPTARPTAPNGWRERGTRRGQLAHWRVVSPRRAQKRSRLRSHPHRSWRRGDASPGTRHNGRSPRSAWSGGCGEGAEGPPTVDQHEAERGLLDPRHTRGPRSPESVRPRRGYLHSCRAEFAIVALSSQATVVAVVPERSPGWRPMGLRFRCWAGRRGLELVVLRLRAHGQGRGARRTRGQAGAIHRLVDPGSLEIGRRRCQKVVGRRGRSRISVRVRETGSPARPIQQVGHQSHRDDLGQSSPTRGRSRPHRSALRQDLRTPVAALRST